ncbi:MAG TPA: hypothetical protein VGM03_13535 [Phycisphaerae bacterium]|jgi:hypothetical protein
MLIVIWQTVTAYALLALAAGYALYRGWHAIKAKSSCGCGSQACGRTTEAERMPKTTVLTPLTIDQSHDPTAQS